MIQEPKKDLIDRKEFYWQLVHKLNEKSGGATFGSTLTFGEILELFASVPVQNELGAEWVLEDGEWKCSSCESHALKSFRGTYPSRYCPFCGRRMEMLHK